MKELFDPTAYYIVTASMAVLAVVVFIALQRITPGYGFTYHRKWGPAINNRAGWIIMEVPAFAWMAVLWAMSPRGGEVAPCVMAALFEIHYFQRAFIFPALMRGKNLMPWVIILLGVVFNVINVYIIAGWLFYVSPETTYPDSWLLSPVFILGAVVFVCGWGINIYSDHVIRNLRKPGDIRHYIPRKGLYRYVTAANYFGEFTEWVGFAILTWSWAGVVFAMWTFANLAPRAKSLYRRYSSEFGEEFTSLGRKYIIPFLY